MALTAEPVFIPAGKQPCATVVFMNHRRETKKFELEWNKETANWWRLKLLPGAVSYYLNNILPRALKFAEKSSTPLQSPTKLVTSSSPMGSVGEEGNAVAVISPSLKPNKNVYNVKTGEVGQVREAEKGDLYIKWGAKSPKRKRTCNAEGDYLVVMPVDCPVPPTTTSQRVIINAHSTKAYVGLTGVVKDLQTKYAHVVLDDGASVRVRPSFLHAIDGGEHEPTLPPNDEAVEIDAEEFFEWLDEYCKKKKVRLVCNMSKTRYFELVEAIKKELGLA